MAETLLIELLTEELPPKSLANLGAAFAQGVFQGLGNLAFVSADSTATMYATPRRLAVSVTRVLAIQPNRQIERKGPAVTSGFDASGNPTSALKGFAKSCGTAVDQLERAKDGKGEFFVFRTTKAGEPLQQHLAGIVQAALKKLPIPKVMRWGDSDVQFVRPAHGLVILHGDRVVPGQVLGLDSRSVTLGHRFLSSGEIKIGVADEYETVLEKKGFVIVSFARRKDRIRAALEAAAGSAKPLWDDALLDEVTALVEFPVVYPGSFSPEFLSVPQECLILSMKQHQKYFPLADAGGKLLPRFLVVSNLETSDSAPIVKGNERVLRARLSDAKFFYDQDRKTRLEARVPKLGNVVYHNQLGTQLERVERLQLLAGKIARQLNADPLLAERAAWLSKADLLTDMVGEFPELQGVMGRYYALHDREPEPVADAIEAHYRPRFAGDRLPGGNVACAVALADKLEALAGMFGIGQTPTGDKDPFALRRHALGMVRILVEGKLPVSLFDLIDEAFSVVPAATHVDARTDLETFVFERLRGYLRECGYTANEVEAVLSMRPARLHQIPDRLAAVRTFSGLPEAESLAAANKRVGNILKQAQTKGETFSDVQIEVLRETAERKLFDVLETVSRQATPLFEQGDYTGYLKTFAVLKSPVDTFFDSVMVMVDDTALRRNRLALLANLRKEMNRVADISKLAA